MGHVLGVRALLARPDIDQVVIIISQRARSVPGTRFVLDAGAALRAFEALLHGETRVVFELAERTAIEHALAFFGRVDTSTKLYFCLGEADMRRGDSRFEQIGALSRRTGVAAELLSLPTASAGVRATDLRAALALGPKGRTTFIAGLPDDVSAERKELAWRACRAGLRDLHEVAAARIAPRLARFGVDAARGIKPVAASSPPAFAARTIAGTEVLIRSAVDEVESAGQTDRWLPRHRYATAKRMLSWLATKLRNGEVEIPLVVGYDRVTRTLIETRVMPEAKTLETELSRGRVDPLIATAAARWLAALHAIEPPTKPIRGTVERERAWWRIHEREVVDQLVRREADFGLGLPRPRPEARVLHLGLVPAHVRIAGTRLGITGFERATSFGDPALDLACFAGAYRDGTATASSAAAAALEAFYAAYAAAGRRHADCAERAAAWVDAGVRPGRTLGPAEPV